MKSWIETFELQGDWISVYIYSFYFTTVTMVTVGYGDISPSNKTEKGVAIFTMFFSCGVFGYTMNKIGKIFD